MITTKTALFQMCPKEKSVRYRLKDQEKTRKLSLEEQKISLKLGLKPKVIILSHLQAREEHIWEVLFQQPKASNLSAIRTILEYQRLSTKREA